MENYTAGEQVTNILREKIFSGEIPDNTELTQTWVAEQLGVSRMPIREALLNLELEGFIERLDNRHTRIIGFNHKQMLSRLHYLSSLESDAAIGIMESDDLKTVSDQLESCLAGTPGRQREILFHSTLFTKGNDRYFNQIYRKVASPTLKLFILHRKSPIEDSYRYLNEIVDNMRHRKIKDIRGAFEQYFRNLQTITG